MKNDNKEVKKKKKRRQKREEDLGTNGHTIWWTIKGRPVTSRQLRKKEKERHEIKPTQDNDTEVQINRKVVTDSTTIRKPHLKVKSITLSKDTTRKYRKK